MRKLAAWLALGGWLLTGRVAAWALDPPDYAFLLSAHGFSSPARIEISWPQKEEVNSIIIRRKAPSDSTWGGVIATLEGDATSFTDTNVFVGQAYAYEFTGVMGEEPFQQTAYGYIRAGINVPADESRGKVILIVDSTYRDALTNELERLRLDLIGDGWQVIRHDLVPEDSVTSVKAFIQADYNADSRNTRAVFLIGHVPVPYSGKLNPDMHEDHLGAWPADVFYGQINGTWTDSEIDFTAFYPGTANIPGDGKFDPSEIPGVVQLEIGRVDFSNLDWLPQSELDLLRHYLDKNHAFRHGLLRAAPRGLIRDNFGVIDNDAPAVDAWRAFPALFGPNGWKEVGPDEFFQTLQNQSYLFAFGCGGGEFFKADGVGNTLDFQTYAPQAIFYLLHGSYFGDWNTPDNFLRAALAGPSAGLVSIWSSLPHWYLHPLALGETIGYVTRLTQNNRDTFHNQVELSVGQVHISMMGDPTLHPFVLAPPQNLRFTDDHKPTLSWDASPSPVDGYYIYRSKDADGPFDRISGLVTDTTYDQTVPPTGRFFYMVRAVATQTTGSGTFQNLSQGIFVEENIIQTTIAPPTLTATGEILFQATGYPSRAYQIEARSPDSSWQPIANGLSDANGNVTFSETPTEQSRWYRVTWL